MEKVMGWNDRCEITELVGKTLKEIKNNNDELIFICSNNERYKMFHVQD
jgi:hypothetical protein